MYVVAPSRDRSEKPAFNKSDINVAEEQTKDDELRHMIEQLIKNKAPRTTYTQFLDIDNITLLHLNQI